LVASTGVDDAADAADEAAEVCGISVCISLPASPAVVLSLPPRTDRRSGE
jgi:hypothetical protein